MCLLTEIILFIPLLAYSCLQVRRLIPSPGLKRIFVLLFVALFLAYPVAETISHQETGVWAAGAILCGYYCLAQPVFVF